MIARFHPAQAKYGVIPAMLLSRNPGVIFALYFCTFVLYGLRPLTSLMWSSKTVHKQGAFYAAISAAAGVI
jgi:hypothetical protein